MKKINLTDITGIGPKTEEYLKEKNINNFEDLIEFYPINYEYYNDNFKSNQLEDKQLITIKGTITRGVNQYSPRKNLTISSYFVQTDNEEYKIIAWNQRHLYFTLKPNNYVLIQGQYDQKNNQIIQKSVQVQEHSFDNIEEPSNDKAEIIPIYSKIKYIKNHKINTIINNAIKLLPNSDYKEALNKIHNPKQKEDVEQSKEILKYYEFKRYYLKLQILKNNNNESNIDYIKKININSINKIMFELPFALTNDQEEVINNIANNFLKPQKTNTLILGDVGSGKTIVSIILSKLLIEAKYQVVMMAPTEILAKQLYNNFKSFIPQSNIELFTGSTTNKDRKRIKEYTSLGIIDIVIGTHALIYDDIEFNNLAIAFIDEQHRFGVEQRNKLIKKTMFGEFIYMSATPIPRTLAQSLFAVMEVEKIKTKPSNRKPIITEVYNNKEKNKMLAVLENQLQKGHQAYIIAPTIEETEIENLENVENIYNNFSKYYQDKYKVGLLHGGFKSKDKDYVMEQFKNKEFDILVATTVIEVGVDVPNASVMMVINAERYGLAQLHQLRGRVGRGDVGGYCLLLDKSNNNVSKERLQILKNTNDGEELAKEDLKTRGGGNFFGKEQSGLAGFKLFDYLLDQHIVQRVKTEYEERINRSNNGNKR